MGVALLAMPTQDEHLPARQGVHQAQRRILLPRLFFAV